MEAEARQRRRGGRWSNWQPVTLEGNINPTALLLDITEMDTVTLTFDEGDVWQYRASRRQGSDGA